MKYAVLAWFLMAAPVVALELSLPSTARQTVARNTAPDRYAAPIGVHVNGETPQLIIEGDVRRAAWRFDAPGLTPLQVMRPLRDQIELAGYEIVLDCAAIECGGYDFRFATETLPGPHMYVNIRSYHFITAVRAKGDRPQDVVTILASTSASSAYAQIIQAGSLDGLVAKVSTNAAQPISSVLPVSDFGKAFSVQGHVILQGLDFKSGTSNLGEGPFASLGDLAAFLKARPNLRIALVGHTDSVGSLDGNIALSRRRAQSVRARLISAYQIDQNRLEAQGMGYLAPIASNLGEAGRDANRRVEAILLSE